MAYHFLLIIIQVFYRVLQITNDMSTPPPFCDLYYRSQHPVSFADVDVEPPKPGLLPDEPTVAPSVESLLHDISQTDLSLIVLWQVGCIAVHSRAGYFKGGGGARKFLIYVSQNPLSLCNVTVSAAL